MGDEALLTRRDFFSRWRGGVTAPDRGLVVGADMLGRGAEPASGNSIVMVSPQCLEAHGVACRACEGRCEAGAMRFRPIGGGRVQLLVDGEACTGCGECLDACPVGALALSSVEQEGEAA